MADPVLGTEIPRSAPSTPDLNADVTSGVGTQVPEGTFTSSLGSTVDSSPVTKPEAGTEALPSMADAPMPDETTGVVTEPVENVTPVVEPTPGEQTPELPSMAEALVTAPAEAATPEVPAETVTAPLAETVETAAVNMEGAMPTPPPEVPVATADLPAQSESLVSSIPTSEPVPSMEKPLATGTLDQAVTAEMPEVVSQIVPEVGESDKALSRLITVIAGGNALAGLKDRDGVAHQVTELVFQRAQVTAENNAAGLSQIEVQFEQLRQSVGRNHLAEVRFAETMAQSIVDDASPEAKVGLAERYKEAFATASASLIQETAKA
jgi:hypothetical protein